jgi:hypothetical protein
MSTLNKTFTDKVVITLLDAVTANKQSDTFPIPVGTNTIEAFVTGSGAVAATIVIYGANTKRTTNGIPLATITLSGTDSDQAGDILTSNWGYMYAILSGISGTSAKVTVTIGI